MSFLKYRPRADTRWCILHASHTLPGKSSVLEWLQVHGREKGLLSIGYHFVIFENGELVSCRPMETQGSHCRGYNEVSVGVCLIGGLGVQENEEGELEEVHVDTFTPAQRDQVRALMSYLQDHYPGIRLRGHTEMPRYKSRHEHHPCPAINMEDLRCSIPLSP